MGTIPGDEGSGIYLFGRDIMSIPCFRQCTLAGVSACIGSTLLHFLFTSNGPKSAKVGYTTFIVVTTPYWFWCRENRYQKDVEIKQIQEAIKKKTEDEYILLDSLEFGPETGV